MKEENIELNYVTIGVAEQRRLLELAHGLNRALTQEEYFILVRFYSKVLVRLEEEANKQGIEI